MAFCDRTSFAATCAASYSAGASQVTALFSAKTLLGVAEIIDKILDPNDVQNGLVIDPEAYRRGLIEGVSRVKDFARSCPDEAWPSPSSEEERTEVEEAIMCGYFGA